MSSYYRTKKKRFYSLLVQANIKRLKYKVKNNILFSKKVELSKRDGSRIRIQSQRYIACHANSGKKNYIIFCSWPLSSLLLKEIFFSPSRKAFNLRFCPVYITVTTGPSVLGWAWHKHKVLSRISGGFDLASWTKLFFHAPEMYKIDSFFNFF